MDLRKQIMKLSFLTAFLVLTAYFIGIASANQLAPIWLKEGAYVKYTTDQAGFAYLANNLHPLISDTLSFWNATFGWHCVSINDTAAKLVVTLSYTGKELNGIPLDNATMQLSSEVYVDLSTMSVYDQNGTRHGTTHIWVPANPVEGQDVVVWNVPLDIVTLPAKCNDVWFLTIQGKQDAFSLEGTAQINNKSRNYLLLCDQDTGLMVDGSFEWDPILNAIGINALLLNGLVILSDTNIVLGPTYDPTNWLMIITFTTLPIVSFAVLFVAFYMRMRKKW